MDQIREHCEVQEVGFQKQRITLNGTLNFMTELPPTQRFKKN